MKKTEGMMKSNKYSHGWKVFFIADTIGFLNYHRGQIFLPYWKASFSHADRKFQNLI